jgi:hypothetical protein
MPNIGKSKPIIRKININTKQISDLIQMSLDTIENKLKCLLDSLLSFKSLDGKSYSGSENLNGF